MEEEKVERRRWPVEATVPTPCACSSGTAEEESDRVGFAGPKVGWSWAWPNSARLHCFFLSLNIFCFSSFCFLFIENKILGILY